MFLGPHYDFALQKHQRVTLLLTSGGASSIMVSRPTSSLILRLSGSSVCGDVGRPAASRAGGVAVVVMMVGTLLMVPRRRCVRCDESKSDKVRDGC